MPPGRSPRCPHRDTRSRRAPSLHRPTARGTILLLPDSRTTGRELARNPCSPVTFPLRAAVAAVALGRRQFGLAKGGLRLEESQAAAAVGQIRLAHAYKELLESRDVTVAQVLLTLEDSERRRRYLNARATLESLLALGALPVINENDTVATAEIRYGEIGRAHV